MKTDETNQNLLQIFHHRCQSLQDRPALKFKDFSSQQYLSITWNEWAECVQSCALGLYSLGVRQNARVALLSENCPEWTYADLGIMSLGAVNVPVYPTSAPDDVAYILDDAEIEVIFLSTLEHYQRLEPVFREKQSLKAIILFQGVFPGDDVRCLSLQDLMEKGRLCGIESPDLYGRQVDAVAPEQAATIIYTSGTTGRPKGVVLTHKNFIANYLGASQVIQVTENDTALSFLPLSHVFERLAGYYFMAFHGACIAYAENMQSVPQDMLVVKPTVAASVPRLYEKIYARVHEQMEAAPPARRKVFAWAMHVGRRVSERVLSGRPVPLVLEIQRRLADALVYTKLKQKLGGRMRFFISGGAPLPRKLGEFFHCLGIVILEGYGLTETSPVIAVNALNALKFGTVGKPLPGVEVRIAEDGEILTRSDCVMQGYYRNPEATAQVIDSDGWFHTGDIGEIDADGFLRITDRKKDIIVTSGGKNISPQNIENEVLSDKLFTQIVVIGDKRNYLVALIVPNRADVEKYADENGILNKDWPQLLKDPRIYGWIESRLKERLADFARYEQIKYFALLPEELTQAAGELTPTLKVKRKVVSQKYSHLIDELYRKGQSFSGRDTTAG